MCFFLSINSFKTRLQACRLVYNCIDCYRRTHDKLHGTQHADCFEFMHLNAGSSQFTFFALMLKELLLQIPANSFSFSLYFFSFFQFVMNLTGWNAPSNLLLTQLAIWFCCRYQTVFFQLYNGWGVLRYYAIMRSPVGTATDSQNVNYSYWSRFLIPMVRWWHITAIKAKSCKVPQFRNETGSVGVTTQEASKDDSSFIANNMIVSLVLILFSFWIKTCIISLFNPRPADLAANQ